MKIIPWHRIYNDFTPPGPPPRFWKFLEKEILQKGFHPYVFAGIGGIRLNPTTQVLAEDIPEPMNNSFSKFTLVIPFGVGFDADITDRISMGFQISSRRPLTDYLDGISDSEKLDWYTFGGINFFLPIWKRLESSETHSRPLWKITNSFFSQILVNIRLKRGW